MMPKPSLQSRYINWFGAIGSIMVAAAPATTLAQIAGDGTLGTQVNGNLTAPCTGNCIITNGATRGSNLFHSFQQFSLPNGDFAGFVTTPAIQNVIVRVTGVGQPFVSNINGTIATVNAAVTNINPANFFLLNPNGIVFGPGATLNIGGSFLATTANRMQFADGTEFRTTDPAPLLTVSVPVGLQLGQAAGNIQMQGSFLSAGETDNFSDFLLISSNVSLNATTVKAPGQRIEFGGVAADGNVGLKIANGHLNLNFPSNIARGNIVLTNGTDVSVAAGGDGSIAFNANNIDVLDGSSVRAGIGALQGSPGVQAGDVTLNATGSIRIVDSSIYDGVFGDGNGGNIQVNANQLIVQDGLLATATLSTGRAGNLTITANSIELTGSPSSNGSVITQIPIDITTLFPFCTLFGLCNFDIPITVPIGLFSASIDVADVPPPPDFPLSLSGLLQSGGDAGNLTINTRNLVVQSGAVVSSGTTTTGRAGNLVVNAADSIVLQGTSANNAPPELFLFTIAGRVPSGLANSTAGFGQGGDTTITTKTLTVRDGAWISSGTGGNQPSGNITLNASDSVDVIGTATANGVPSVIATSTAGGGNAGDLSIKTQRLRFQDGAIATAGTSSTGLGGDLTINATDSVELIGTSSTPLSAAFIQQLLGLPGGRLFPIVEGRLFPSGLITGTASDGDAGNLSIKTGRLVIQDGAQASISTVGGKGDAGQLRIVAQSVELIGTSAARQVPNAIIGPSLLSTAVGQQASGRGGNIFVQTGSLQISQGARLSADTTGNGAAGSISVQGATTIEMSANSSISTAVNQGAIGNGGNIDLQTQSLSLDSGAQITASTFGQGTAGALTITADFVDVSRGSQFQTTTANNRDAGNISFNVRDRITLSGADTGLFANTTPESSGNGGSIFIDPKTVTIQDGARIAVDSQGSGQGGSIQIQAGRLTLDQQGAISAQTASNQGGNITLNVQDLLLLRHGSQISTTAGTAQAGGDGGKITINSRFIVAVLAENSDITANAFTGSGGSVDLTAQGIFGLRVQPQLTPLSDITASSRFGINGTVTLNVLNLDPSRGLVALPLNPTDPSQQISQSCTPGGKTAASSFVFTGRGGLPLNPDEPLESRAVVTQWVPLPEGGRGGEGTRGRGDGEAREAGGSQTSNDPTVQALRVENNLQYDANPDSRRSSSPQPTSTIPASIVEAQGWVARADGTIELVDHNAVAGSSVPGLAIATCQHSLP